MKAARGNSKFIGTALGLALSLVSLSAYARDKGDTASEERAQTALEGFTTNSPGLQDRLDAAAGYIVFPEVDKGGLVVGGARGWGVMYEQGVPVGRVKLTQVSVGAQIGAQKFSELIILEDEDAVDDFKKSRRTLAAGTSTVGVGESASKNLQFRDGVAVMTMAQSGLMAEASIGGQKFKFRPLPRESKRVPQT